MYGKEAQYYYKALMHVDAYGIRKSNMKMIFESETEFHNQMAHY